MPSRFVSQLVLLSSLAVALSWGAAQAAELTGRVVMLHNGRASRADVETAVVMYTPSGQKPPRPLTEPAEMVTHKKEFQPHVLAVPVGSRVRFPNQDPILHNVFSVSGDNHFDVGLYGRGSGKTVAFQHPGVVSVFCNVHHSMVGYILVLDTPHYTSPQRDGRFRLSGLPPGAGVLTVWHERAELFHQSLEIPHSGDLEVMLQADKPRIPRHLNKFGRPYRLRRGYR